MLAFKVYFIVRLIEVRVSCLYDCAFNVKMVLRSSFTLCIFYGFVSTFTWYGHVFHQVFTGQALSIPGLPSEGQGALQF